MDGRRDEQSSFQAREIESKETKPDHVQEIKRGHLYTLKNKKTSSVSVTVCKHSFQASKDTGATINVIDHATLKKTNMKTFVYNATEPVKFQGKFEATVEKKNTSFGTALKTAKIEKRPW